MRDLISRWSARTGVISLAVILTLALGLTIASAAFQGGSDQTTLTSDPSSSSDPLPTSSPDGGEGDGSDANGGGGAVNNEVVVRNTTDGRTAHREGSGIARVTGGDVLNTNSAAAVGACTDCRTVAIATQIVLVMGDSQTIAPRNQAVAINSGCLRCETYALAYQYVVSTDGIVRFTGEGMQRLADLQSQIRALGASDLPYLELEAQVDALVEQMWAVVDEEIIAVGGRPQGESYEASDEAEGTDSSPSPSPTVSTSPKASVTPEAGSSEPSGTSTPSPADNEISPSPTPSTEPEASPSTDPSP